MTKEDCLFEITYIKREEEILKNSDTVYKRRIEIGRELGRQFPIDADYVIPMPETAVFNAIGYHLETNVPFCLGVYKVRPKIKTLFIDQREIVLKNSMIPIPDIIEEKKIVVIDETIISGLTLKTNIDNLKKFNPREIHLRIAISPMIRKCPSSDFGDSWQFLFENEKNLADYFGIDSIEWLSVNDFEKSVKCTYCFGGLDDKSKMVRIKL